jgi:hypothetical protein
MLFSRHNSKNKLNFLADYYIPDNMWIIQERLTNVCDTIKNGLKTIKLAI